MSVVMRCYRRVHTWDLLDSDDNPVGIVTSLAYSRKYGSNIAFAKVRIEFSAPGNILSVELDSGERRRVEVVTRSWERVAPHQIRFADLTPPPGGSNASDADLTPRCG